jgi:hypothetical protein
MYPLDPSPEQMREMGEAALTYVIDFIGGLADAPAENTDGALELARRLRAKPPEEGGPFEDAFAEMREAAARTFEYSGTAHVHPGQRAVRGRLGTSSRRVNRYVGLWQPSPAAADRENVARWLCSLFGMRSTSRGLSDGGSMANFSPRCAHAGRGLPRRHVLRERAVPCVGHEGGDARGLL